jgi:hypothetical protein
MLRPEASLLSSFLISLVYWIKHKNLLILAETSSCASCNLRLHYFNYAFSALIFLSNTWYSINFCLSFSFYFVSFPIFTINCCLLRELSGSDVVVCSITSSQASFSFLIPLNVSVTNPSVSLIVPPYPLSFSREVRMSIGFSEREGICGTVIYLAILLVVLRTRSETSSDFLIGVEVSSNNLFFFILIAVIGLETCFSCVDFIFTLED